MTGSYPLATLLAFLFPVLTVFGQADPVPVRVLSYNIHHGQGLDGRIDLDRIAAVVRSASPHLVALQEVDRGARRTNQIDQPRRLAELTGLKAVFEKNIDFDGGAYGNAVLTSLPVESHQNHLLPRHADNEQRGLLEVRVRVGTQPLVFLATHLDHQADDRERLAAVDTIRSLLTECPDMPVILAGDLNALPDSPVITKLTAVLNDTCQSTFSDSFTFPADIPNRRIDYILFNHHPFLRHGEFRVLAEKTASDHRPVLAAFTLASCPSTRPAP